MLYGVRLDVGGQAVGIRRVRAFCISVSMVTIAGPRKHGGCSDVSSLLTRRAAPRYRHRSLPPPKHRQSPNHNKNTTAELTNEYSTLSSTSASALPYGFTHTTIILYRFLCSAGALVLPIRRRCFVRRIVPYRVRCLFSFVLGAPSALDVRSVFFRFNVLFLFRL